MSLSIPSCNMCQSAVHAKQYHTPERTNSLGYPVRDSPMLARVCWLCPKCDSGDTSNPLNP